MSNSFTSNSESTLLSGSWKPGPAILIWASMFLILNVCVLGLGKYDYLEAGLPIELIAECVQKTSNPADYWLFGNSTLARSVNESQFEESAGVTIHKVPIGSGTLSAQVELAKLCLEESMHPPRVILFFATKDDFNVNGARAKTSENYHRVMTDPELADRIGRMIPLYVYRSSLRTKSKNFVLAAKRRLATTWKKTKSKPHRGKSKPKPLTVESQSGYLAELGQDYAFDAPAIAELIALKRNHPAITIGLIHPPVTDAVERWQETYARDRDWGQIKASIKTEFEAGGGVVFDFSNTYPSSPDFFRDVYHMNEAGANSFTQRLSSLIDPDGRLTGPEKGDLSPHSDSP